MVSRFWRQHEVARQGRREARYAGISGRPRTPHGGVVLRQKRTVYCRKGHLNALDSLLAKQAVGLHEEDEHERDVRHELLRAGDVDLGELLVEVEAAVLLEQADDRASDNRSGNGIQPAEDDDGEDEQAE